MQQLTAEDREIIFGLYIGSQFKYNTGIGTVCGKTIDAVGRYSDNKHQLILRHISKISDEDAIEVAKITDVVADTGLIVSRGLDCVRIYDKYNDTVDSKMKDGIIEFHLDCLEIFYWSDGKVQSSDLERHLRIIDFLRSRSYMLPYNGVDLFEAGIAIEQP